jgi:hypothetical protein
MAVFGSAPTNVAEWNQRSSTNNSKIILDEEEYSYNKSNHSHIDGDSTIGIID